MYKSERNLDLVIQSQKNSFYRAMEPFYLPNGSYSQDLFNIVYDAVMDLPLPLSLEAFGAILTFSANLAAGLQELEEKANKERGRIKICGRMKEGARAHRST